MKRLFLIIALLSSIFLTSCIDADGNIVTPSKMEVVIVSGEEVSGLVTQTGLVFEERYQGMYLNGTGTDGAEYPQANFRGNDNAGTVEVWASTLGAGDYTLFSAGDEVGGTQYWTLRLIGGKLFASQLTSGSLNIAESNITFNDGLVHQFVVTSNSTNKKLYIDGAAAAFTWSSGSDNGLWFNDHSNTLDNVYVGSMHWNGTYGQGMVGYIYEVRVYSNALSPAEILTNYNLRSPAY